MAKDTEWGLLGGEDEKWIAAQILRLLPLLADKRRRAWAYKLIDTLLWFWTADAVHPDGDIKRDAVKFDPRYVRHTDAALRSLTHGVSTKGEKVHHEHAGERTEIIEVLRREAKTVPEVLEVLKSLNVAVLVTKDQHHALGKREWPADWKQRNWASHYEARKIAVRLPTRLSST